MNRIRSPVQTRPRDCHPAALSNTGPGMGLQVVLELDEIICDVHAFFWGRIHSCHHGLGSATLKGLSLKSRLDPSQV